MTNEIEKTSVDTTRSFLSIKKMVRDIYNKQVDPNFVPRRETIMSKFFPELTDFAGNGGHHGAVAGGIKPSKFQS